MIVSRRWFIGGAASFGAFGGCRMFECHDFRAGGRPNLTFGVVSDIHVSRMTGDPAKDVADNTATLRHAFEYFRDAGVDAVVIAGDMADNGVMAQLEVVAAAWRSVFPNDRALDGRKVEKLFVYGNHDLGGLPYARGLFKGLPDGEIEKRIILPDPKAVWERVFEEAYAPIWVKEVRGYSFVGAHWLVRGCRGKDEAFNAGIGDFYAAKRMAFDPKKPFFHIQHPHPKDTCYGSWAWGRDVGLSTKALSAFPNAVAFSGHSHYPLTDERSVWQGAFTSVGTASLRYLDYTYNEFSPEGFENTTCDGGRDAWRLNAEKMTPRIYAAGRQGMVWRVYDDCMAVERRDLQFDQSVGPDWVIPLEMSEPRPFAFAERAKKSVAPRFAEGAKLELSRVKAKNRGGKNKDEIVAAIEQDAIRVLIPPVAPDPNARVYLFEVTASGGGKTRTKRVVAKGSSNALGHAEAAAGTECVFAMDDFLQGPVTVSVVPENWFHRRGEAISGTV